MECGMARCDVAGECGCGGLGRSQGGQDMHELEFERGVWAAALHNDLPRVERLLARNPGLARERDASGFFPLHYAARAGHEAMCSLLLSHGADANSTTPSLATPLHRACFTARLSTVQLLVRHAAHPLLRDADGMTSVHKAAQGGSVACVRAVVGCDGGHKACGWVDVRGRTPYRLAVHHHPHHQELLRLLATPQAMRVEEWMSFAMGTHAVLGENSPVRALSRDVLRSVWDALTRVP